jgi:O-antigen ligase
VPVFIVLLCLTSILQFVQNKGTINTPINKLLYLPIVYYALHVVSFFILHNKASAFDLELKLSFVVVPLCFISNASLSTINLRSVAQSLVIGCVAAMVLCVINAGYVYNYTFDTSSFFYSTLSYYHHPSYFAMYLSVGLLCIYYLSNTTPNKWTWLNRTIATLFVVFIVALGSKAGMLVIALLSVVYLINLKLSLTKLLLSAGLGLAILIAVVYTSPLLRNRINEGYSSLTNTKAVDKTQYVTTTDMRTLVWQDALILIKQKPLGYGTANTNTALATQYIKSGNTQAAQKQLNAHNQYLQTTLALGIVGLIVLLLLLFYPLGVLPPYTKTMYALCIGIVAFNLLSEAMFETQSGVVFFVFMYCILVTQRYFNAPTSRLQIP